MLDRLTLAIVDLETTGASPLEDRVIEIGVLRVERGRVVATLSSLIDPERPVPADITRLTGITDADLAGAPTFGQVRAEVQALLHGCVFVAHNVRFDYGFLRQEFARAGRDFSASLLCTVRLSRRLYPEHRLHGLSHLIERFALACPNRHRALGDAEAVWAFLQRAAAELEPARFTEALETLLRAPVLPPQLQPADLAALPEGPGVYILRDAEDQPLYVGQSADVRGRVLAQFAGDQVSAAAQALAQAVARIEVRPTFGELGTRLLAAHLVAALRPAHHRLPPPGRRPGVRRRMIRWPYGGVVAVEEAAPDRLRGHAFIFDAWRLARALAYEGEEAVALFPPETAPTDDTYAILSRYLLQRPARPRRLTPAEAARWLDDADPVAA